MKKSRNLKLCIILILMGLTHVTFGQNLDTVVRELGTASAQILKIIKIILWITLAYGIVGVVWAFVSNEGQGKKWLVSFVVALIVAVIGLTVLGTASSF